MSVTLNASRKFRTGQQIHAPGRRMGAEPALSRTLAERLRAWLALPARVILLPFRVAIVVLRVVIVLAVVLGFVLLCLAFALGQATRRRTADAGRSQSTEDERPRSASQRVNQKPDLRVN